ncbi:MAG: IS630 family transposase [Phycisphaerales bacterium]|nr:IS630 family transposase [Phycisphaerales bacterium]
MSQLDTRKLSPQVQEEIRVRVVKAIRAGMRKSAAARTFGVSRTSIDTWLAKVECGNITSLRSKKRGRPPEPRLASHRAAAIVRQITDRTPDQLKLAFALWTREAVRDLIAQRTGLQVSVRTVSRYLKRWGFTPQKPLRRAYERDPAAVERWKRARSIRRSPGGPGPNMPRFTGPINSARAATIRPGALRSAAGRR